jgi:hypothetical protein
MSVLRSILETAPWSIPSLSANCACVRSCASLSSANTRARYSSSTLSSTRFCASGDIFRNSLSNFCAIAVFPPFPRGTKSIFPFSTEPSAHHTACQLLGSRSCTTFDPLCVRPEGVSPLAADQKRKERGTGLRRGPREALSCSDTLTASPENQRADGRGQVLLSQVVSP